MYYHNYFISFSKIYLLARKTDRETEEDLSTDSHAKCPQHPRLKEAQARARKSKWISHIGARKPSAQTIILHLPGTQAEGLF